MAGSMESGSVRTAVNNGNKILLFHEDAFFWALSRECTHRSCKVSWNADQRTVRCPCHGSQYTGDGTNVAGPAPRPLAWFRLSIASDDGQLVVDLADEVAHDFRLTLG